MRHLIILISIVFLISCSDNSAKKKIQTEDTTTEKKPSKAPKYFRISAPNIGQRFTIGDNIDFKVSSSEDIQVDSIRIRIDQDLVNFESDQFEINWSSQNSRVGNIPFNFEIYYQGKSEFISGYIELLSDIVPEKKKYRIVNTYPHDIYAYTQGLVYDNGFLYEGTGQYNQSSLRKVKLETGELVQSYKLPNDIFGEGITLYNDKIIQLTYKSWIGYVYDRSEFKLLYKFNYPVPIEGWGIEYNGQHLIVSDGTSNLMFFDPDSFTEIYRIQVFDDKGPVEKLNELEYYKGDLYANVYLTNKVLKIDPIKGKVLEEIDLSGILPQKDYHQNIDVLNGIAIDRENNRIFVTGKYWPKLFEIEIL